MSAAKADIVDSNIFVCVVRAGNSRFATRRTGRLLFCHYAIAAKLIRPLAEQGNVFAQFSLGGMYALGRGAQRDDNEAVKWFLLAAEQGDAKAQYNLGIVYHQGKGVPQDYKEAMKWYRFFR